MNARRTLGVLFLGFTLLAGCSAEAPPEDRASEVGELVENSAPTHLEAVARAMEWSDAKLQYCWAPNGGDNHKAGNYACPQICVRQKNPQWDPYRSDCSGLVSWAWNLPAPGRTTLMFFPFQTDITEGIQAKDLRPGDAINNKTHIMLFKEWVTPGKRAVFIEEPGCSATMSYAHETTSDVTINDTSITLAGRSTFTAIRYKALKVGDAPKPPKPQAPEEEPTAPPTNEPEPTPTAPAPTEPTPTEPPPAVTPATKGALDKVSCDGLKGWAIGPANTAVDVELSFFAELGRQGSAVTKTAANVRRDDLPASQADFGFSIVLPLGVRDGKEHPVSAYATDIKGNALRIDQPKSFSCPPPKFPMKASEGVRRLVAKSGLEAWKLTEFENVAKEPSAEGNEFGVGPRFPEAPIAIQGTDSKDVFVIDGELRRPVDAAGIKAWRLVPRKRADKEIELLARGPAWPSAPFFYQGESAEIYALDAKLPDDVGTTPSSVTPTAEEDESAGAGEDGQPEASDAESEPSGDSPAAASKAKKKIATSGCSASPSSSTSDALGALALAAAILTTRRRRANA